jgi:tetratricopeptide (TPR) repeat protein
MSWTSRGAFALFVGTVAVACGAEAPPAYADHVLLADEGWWPKPEDKSVPPVPANEEPSDEQLVQGEGKKVDAAYDVVKAQGLNKPAGLVLKILSSARAQNEDFKRALVDAQSGDFGNAAEEFAAAAGALTGFAKQDALICRVRAYAEAGVVDKVLPAIDDLLAAFPKSFFLAEVQTIRAKIAASKNDTDGAAKALAAIQAAPGMNPRDVLKARLATVFLTLEIKGKFPEARDAYQKLADDAGRTDPLMGEATKQKSLVGLGNCLLALKDTKKATDTYQQATTSKDSDVLAGAYSGLGDIDFSAAREMQASGKLKETKDLLDAAALKYLRVTGLYGDRENVDPAVVIRAQSNLARVLHAIFDMTQGKDLEALERALKEYWTLVKNPGFQEGPEKNKVKQAIRDLTEKRTELLAGPKKPPPPENETPGMGGK